MNRKELQAIIEHNQNGGPIGEQITVINKYGRNVVWIPVSIEISPYDTSVIVRRVDFNNNGDAVMTDHFTTYQSKHLAPHLTIGEITCEQKSKIERLNMVASIIQSSLWAMDPVQLADRVAERLNRSSTENETTMRDYVLRHHLSTTAQTIIADRFDLVPIGNVEPVECWWHGEDTYRVSFDVTTSHLVALLTELTVGDRS